MTVQFIVGDALETLRTLPAKSVDLVVASPPFLALRSYLPADHPDKAKEMGSEGSPGAFLDRLLDVIEECARVLTEHGSIAIELGDTYSGSGGAGGDYNENGLREGQAKFKAKNTRYNQPDNPAGRTANRTTSDRPGWPLDKSLCLIPELTRFALAYGFNPLTGRVTPRWRLRNVIRWCRPNPPVGALADKVRPATSDILIACKGRKRYFDLDAVRTPLTAPGRVFNHQEDPNPIHGWATSGQNQNFTQNAAGAPPLDHWWADDEDVFSQDSWKVSTVPYKGAHYATYPPKLIAPLVEMMCPREVCRVCGKPRERIVRAQRTLDGKPAELPPMGDKERLAAVNGVGHWRMGTERTLGGWTDCGHEAYRLGLVLDPFAGTGVTGAVASGCGRDAILVDLDERNLDLARERVGMFLEVSPTATPPHSVSGTPLDGEQVTPPTGSRARTLAVPPYPLPKHENPPVPSICKMTVGNCDCHNCPPKNSS